MRKLVLLALIVTSAALPLRADLRSDIESRSGWVGYAVPIIAGDHLVCSWESGTTFSNGHDARGASSELHVLYEVENRRIISIRLSSPECRDTRTVQRLEGVTGKESVRLLRRLIDEDSSLAKKAIGAMAMHRDATDDDLIALARHASPRVRGQSLFWISQRAGEKAALTLRDAVRNDPDEDVKAKAVFGISQLSDDRSIPMLIELLNTHKSRNVRKKAAFWLGQKDDPRALKALEEILTRTPTP